MKHLFRALVVATSLAAQDNGQEAKPQAPVEKETTETPPVAAPESNVTGSLEVGNRWMTNVAGSFNAYRSVVNLGEGPKLLGADLTVIDPKKRIFDRAEVRGYNWGDDPYSTLQLNARKGRIYRLDLDYRNISYFNNLPSFANPLLDRGILLSQRSFDIRRRLVNFQLDLLPGNWLTPYFAYERSAGEGRGVTTFVSEGNEYETPDILRENTANYRGGIRLELKRAHVTLEQGGATYRDDQQVYSTGPHSTGNRTAPLLGQNLFLDSLQQSYRIRGSGIFSKGQFTANPVSWADIHGHFVYTLPSNDTHFEQTNSGKFWNGQNIFFNAEQFLLSTSAKLPRSFAGLGGELRPMRRLRIITSWVTDRLHVSSSSQGLRTLPPTTATTPARALQDALLATNYSQEQVDAIFDLSSSLTIRAGYRYVWGDATSDFTPPTGLAGAESSKLTRHVALAGFVVRPVEKLHVYADMEVASSYSTYFRTSLRNYQKGRARVRYQVASTISASADFHILNNQNPLAGIRYDFLSRQSSVSVAWSPNGGKRFSLHGDYARATLRSDLDYIAPPFFQRERSSFRDNSHTASMMVDLALPGARGPQLSLGGSLVVTSGSRPTEYFQPQGKISAPVYKNVSWVSQWRYYGFGESLYPVEAFRTHLITVGLLISR